MKKFLPIVLILLISKVGFGQTYLLEEFFNDSINFPPASWTIVDQDDDGYNWRINTWDNGSFTEIYAVSDSWLSGGVGALTPENYLISPQIDLTGLVGEVKVRYTVQVANIDYPAEKYKLAVSTTGNQVADFINVVLTETLDTNVYYVWKERIVDLTQFIGQHVYLTWCHFDCTDEYKFLLDSIQVYNILNPGIENPSLNAMIQVYPNPVSRTLTISGDYTNARLLLSGVDGREVFAITDQNRVSKIDVSEFESGIYFLRIETPKGIVIKKVAINN